MHVTLILVYFYISFNKTLIADQLDLLLLMLSWDYAIVSYKKADGI